jgi:hypothetical protein
MTMYHILSGILFVTVLGFTLPAEGTEQPEKQSSQGGELLSSAQSEEQAAADSAAPQPRREGAKSGIAKDQLQTCLKNIPADSSAGQRMLAEQRCHSEQEAATSSHAAPTF